MSGVGPVSMEVKIRGAVRALLVDDVNGLLDGLGFHVPSLELGDSGGREAVVPLVSLAASERTEKERIVRVNAYSVEIQIPVDDLREWDGETLAYCYGAAIERAVGVDNSLGGIVDRAVITKMEYVRPKRRYCGDHWIVAARLRVTVEGLKNDG